MNPPGMLLECFSAQRPLQQQPRPPQRLQPRLLPQRLPPQLLPRDRRPPPLGTGMQPSIIVIGKLTTAAQTMKQIAH